MAFPGVWQPQQVLQETTEQNIFCVSPLQMTLCLLSFSPFFFNLPAKQQFIAIADYYGTLHILEIPWTLSHPSFNEVSKVSVL